MRIKNFPSLIFSVAICQFAGVIGSLFTAPAISGWYEEIQKPWFTPPGWLIGAAWVILFTLMGIALYLVWQEFSYARATGGREIEEKAKRGLVVFAIQLLLNIFWSYLFFGLHSPLLAFLEIILLWVAIYFTIRYFSEVNVKAAYFLIPYLVWVSFAAILNFSILRLNF